MKKKIIVIDDKDHALKQIMYCFPQDRLAEYDFIHYLGFKFYAKKEHDTAEIIFLDFFLDYDRSLGHLFVDKLKTKILIGFSSNRDGSLVIKKAAESLPQYQERAVYAVEKIKGSLVNRELQDLLKDILV